MRSTCPTAMRLRPRRRRRRRDFGGIDILINNAGVTQPVQTLEIDEL